MLSELVSFPTDGLWLQSRLAKGLVNDLGDGYNARFEQDDRGCEITINECLYRKILEDAGKQQLLQACCCSQDASWYGFDALIWYSQTVNAGL